MTDARVISRRTTDAGQSMSNLIRFLTEPPYAARRGDADICDFTFGNPHEMPPAGFLAALRNHIEPSGPSYYAYTENVEAAQRAIAEELRAESGCDFAPEDICMTTGAFGAIAVTFAMLLDPGDECVFFLPPWFLYEPMLRHLGAVPKKIPLRGPHFDLDLEALESTLTERTRLVIVNTPCNPTGRIYTPETLDRLAAILERAEQRFGHPIYLLSDEPYRKLRFEGRPFVFPAAHYPRTLMSYSWGKITLTPGARLGYLAIGPNAPEREALRSAAFSTQVSGGWFFPNALLQHATPDLMDVSIDLAALERRRDRFVQALRDAGYALEVPEATFYLLVKSPIEDDMAFAAELAKHDVFVLPGTICEVPGYVRICFTATEAMIEKSLPIFREVRAQLAAD